MHTFCYISSSTYHKNILERHPAKILPNQKPFKFQEQLISGWQTANPFIQIRSMSFGVIVSILQDDIHMIKSKFTHTSSSHSTQSTFLPNRCYTCCTRGPNFLMHEGVLGVGSSGNHWEFRRPTASLI